jgi:hypothetical protein
LKRDVLPSVLVLIAVAFAARAWFDYLVGGLWRGFAIISGFAVAAVLGYCVLVSRKKPAA